MKKTTHQFILIVLAILSVFTIFTSSRTMAAGINKKSVTLQVGKKTTLSVSGKARVQWKSSASSIASVSKKGVVKAKKAGNCKITASVKNKKWTCKVKVVKKALAGSTGKGAASSDLQITTAGMSAKEAAACKAILAKRTELYEGRRWTNDNYYRWNGGLFGGGYGCAAFAFCLSDAAFGNAPAKRHTSLGDIRVGDLLRTEHDTHMVIVLSVTPSGVVVAEGNYNSSIHWGRIIKRSALSREVDYVLTRY